MIARNCPEVEQLPVSRRRCSAEHVWKTCQVSNRLYCQWYLGVASVLIPIEWSDSLTPRASTLATTPTHYSFDTARSLVASSAYRVRSSWCIGSAGFTLLRFGSQTRTHSCTGGPIGATIDRTYTQLLTAAFKVKRSRPIHLRENRYPSRRNMGVSLRWTAATERQYP